MERPHVVGDPGGLQRRPELVGVPMLTDPGAAVGVAVKAAVVAVRCPSTGAWAAVGAALPVVLLDRRYKMSLRLLVPTGSAHRKA